MRNCKRFKFVVRTKKKKTFFLCILRRAIEVSFCVPASCFLLKRPALSNQNSYTRILLSCQPLLRMFRPPLSARSHSTFPCAYEGTATLPMPMSYRGLGYSAATMPVDLRGFGTFEAFLAAARPPLRRFCENNYHHHQSFVTNAASLDGDESSFALPMAAQNPSLGTEEIARDGQALGGGSQGSSSSNNSTTSSSSSSGEVSPAAQYGAREDAREASIAACAVELEMNLNAHVIEACDDFDYDSALPA